MCGRHLITVVLVALATGSTACLDGSRRSATVPGGEGPCVNIAIFEGQEYSGSNAVVHPVPGDVIGEARLPACHDPNVSTSVPDEFVKVARLPGVDPDVAIVDAGIPEVIYVRSDLASWPAES